MGKDYTDWEENINDAVGIALKASQEVIDKKYKLIVFELVLRKMLDLKFQPIKFP